MLITRLRNTSSHLQIQNMCTYIQRRPMNCHEKRVRSNSPRDPKLTTARRSLSPPMMVGTETASSTSSDLGPTKRRSRDSPGWPTATPSASAGFISELVALAAASTELRSVTMRTSSALSGMKAAAKYWLLTPAQLYVPARVAPPETFLEAR